ncbi:glycosyltransferase family 2 protein [Salinivirga cyanobacteriivorans]
MKKKKVSVIIPTYNRASSIVDAIESVLAQSYPVYEIIIVDDCSIDDTTEVIESINSPLIRYYRNAEQKGAGYSRNYGIKQSAGDYISFLDSDDTWDSDKTEKQLLCMEQHQLDVTSCLMKIFNKRGTTTWPQFSIDGDIMIADFYPEIFLINYFGTPTLMIRKSVLKEVGGFDEFLPRWQDWELLIRIAERYKIGILNQDLVNVYEGHKSITQNNDLLTQTVEYFLKKYQNEINSVGRKFASSVMAKYSRFLVKSKAYKKARKLAFRSLKLYCWHLTPYFSILLTFDRFHVYFKIKNIQTKRG